MREGLFVPYDTQFTNPSTVQLSRVISQKKKIHNISQKKFDTWLQPIILN